MIDNEEFRKQGRDLVDWIADYFEKIEEFPVKSRVKPGEIFSSLPTKPPVDPESYTAIFGDFETKLFKGITHWQSPSFHAYFSANNSYSSVLAEMLMSALGVQGMVWDTSPSATELEQLVLQWLKNMMDLPDEWDGVIQSGASLATLCAILSARERALNFVSNQSGLFGASTLRIYCSEQTHSSVEKAVRIAGIGSRNLVKIPVNDDFSINVDALKDAIEKDVAQQFIPACIIAASGTTGSLAFDDIEAAGKLAQEHNIWLHVDAAYAGSAAICPEYRYLQKGIELADSYVFNPHKWLFTNFDCSVYYVKNKHELIDTFQIQPEYLKTEHDFEVVNFKDWGVELGRRFRALKLWFVIRSFGVAHMQSLIRNQVSIAAQFEKWLLEDGRFEILAPRKLTLVCFRVVDPNLSEKQNNEYNEQLMKQVNDTGKVYITHTKLNGKFTLRAVFSQTAVEQRHAKKLFDLILEKMG